MTDGNPRGLPSRTPDASDAPLNEMLSKVPEVTVYFWVIKVLSTTVGETASDFMNVSLGFGLIGTSIAMGLCLVAVLFFQFRARQYIPWIYWLAVVLISVFGTLITDILTDSLGVPLEASTAVFSVALVVTFAVWYAKDGTLSIKSIFTRRRESFYWLAVLFTFALGTAAGDLMAEKLGLGYLVTGIIVCAAIAATTIAWRFKLDAVLAFWIAYILTRPLGASLGDYLSQTQANGGLGLGASITTAGFTIAIVAVVAFLTVTRRDVIARPSTKATIGERQLAVVWQCAVVVPMLVLTAGSGYYWRSLELRNQAAANASPAAPLGDLSAFRQIAEDTLGLVRAGNLSRAKSRIGDLEFAWDNAEGRLRAMNSEKWTSVDGSIDDVLRKLRAVRQDATACGTSLESLIAVIDTLGDQSGPPKARPVAAAGATLGDLSPFRTIAEECLALVKKGDLAKAKARITDLETAWDEAEERLQPLAPDDWTNVDESIDRALANLRAGNPDAGACATALTTLIAKCNLLGGNCSRSK
jgi:uncharacterized membrane-anchored protein